MNIEQGKREWTSEEVEGVREAVLDVMVKDELSQAEVSRRSQVSGPTLNQFMGNKYQGNNGKVAADLSKWLDAHHSEAEFRLTAPPEPTFVRTQTATKIFATLQHAQLLQDVAVIVGPPGIGKSAALDKYALSTPRVVKVTASPALSTPSAVLGEIGERYSNVNVHSDRSLASRSRIVRQLLGKGHLLIVDEAQHVALSTLEELRSIHDAAKCGLVLVGNRTVLNRIQGASRDVAYAQLFGRVGSRLELTKGGIADVQAVLETMNVTAREVVEVAQGIAKREDLRVMVKTTRYALLLAAGAQENLEPKHMRAAYRQLAGEAAA